MQDLRIEIVLKAAEHGFSITAEAATDLQACTLVDPMLVLDRILSGLVSVEIKPPIITAAHVHVAMLSFVHDDMIRERAARSDKETSNGGYLS
jgi:hypothetical protein